MAVRDTSPKHDKQLTSVIGTMPRVFSMSSRSRIVLRPRSVPGMPGWSGTPISASKGKHALNISFHAWLQPVDASIQ